MAKRMQEQKGEERSVAKSKSTAMNLSSHVPTSSSSAKSPIASKSSEILIVTGKPENQDEKKFEIRRSVEFSSATASCTPRRDDGHSHGETCRYKKGIRGCGPFESETGSEGDVTGDRLLVKQLRGNTMHPVNQKAREVQKLRGQKGHTIYTCLQPQFITRKQYSRSSGKSTDENMTTLWMIWT